DAAGTVVGEGVAALVVAGAEQAAGRVVAVGQSVDHGHAVRSQPDLGDQVTDGVVGQVAAQAVAVGGGHEAAGQIVPLRGGVALRVGAARPLAEGIVDVGGCVAVGVGD